MTSRWAILAVLFLARSMIGFQFQSLTSVGGSVMADLQLSATQFGALVGVYVLPGLVLAFPGGLVSDRMVPRWVAAAALALMAAGSAVMSLGASFLWLYAGRLIGGGGYAVLTVVIARMVAEWFAARDLMRANGIVLASWPAGLAVGLLVQPPLADALGWRGMMAATGGVCLAAALMLVTLYRSPVHAAGPARAVRPALRPSRAELLAALVAGAAWGGFNLALVLFFSFGPRQLVERGIDATEAGAITSLGMWVGAASTMLGGYIAQRAGRPMVVVALSCLLGALGLAAFAAGTHLLLASALLGLSIGPAAAVIVALPVEGSRSESLGASFGVFYGVFFVMVGLGPMAAGWLEEISRSIAAAVWLGAVFMPVSAGFVCLFYGLLRARRPAA